ncbi:MAG: hypothetical protein DME57_05995 [Verrucomicrobia bacterium]|nr:MAG: hypothetical protein DME57_05995 [Verrucomicrobiota bacterium]
MQPGASIPLKIFFGLIEVVIIYVGIYFIRHREKFFGHKSDEDDTYASANLRMVMVVLVWIHSFVITAIMIFEV